MKTVIAGATGLIGRAISSQLLQYGNEVTALVRSTPRSTALPDGVVSVVLSETDSSWKGVIANADVVINLAGAPIGKKRWNDEVKAEIVQSRVGVTRRIADAIIECCSTSSIAPALINASAVGYYGDCGSEVVAEERASGSGFLADVCSQWESEAMRAREAGSRVVLLRIGLVLAKSGLLEKMLYPLPIRVSPFKMGLGGPVGSGRQWMPWIHLEDITGLVGFIATHPELSGPVNACSPNPVTGREFAQALGRVLHRPAVLALPTLALRAVVGEFADSIVMSTRAMPEAALRAGYIFRYPDLETALRTLV